MNDNKISNGITNANKKKNYLRIKIGILILFVITLTVVLGVKKTIKEDNVQEQLRQGALNRDRQDYKQAISAYHKAIVYDKKCAKAYVNLAEVYGEIGEFDVSERIFSIALEKVNDINDQEWIREKRDEFNDFEKRAERVSVGGYISFGAYEQDDKIDNGSEEIVWLVLEKKNRKMLLLSKYVLDVVPFNLYREDTTWEKCTLREWLNNDFFQTAFRKEERERIIETYVINENDPYYSGWTTSGNNTYDKVFILNIEEATTYFSSELEAFDSKRTAKATAFTKNKNIMWCSDTNDFCKEYYDNAYWFLRSMVLDDAVSFVSSFGDIIASDYPVDMEDIGVRPAIWIEY